MALRTSISWTYLMPNWNFAFIQLITSLFMHSGCLVMAFAQTSLSQEYPIHLRPDFNPSVCVEAGTTVKIACTVESLLEHGATIWNGSEQIFNCSSVNTIEIDQLFLRHPYFEEMNTHVAHCGDLVSATLFTENITTFVSEISITTTSDMNGGYVRCTDLRSQLDEDIQLLVTDAPLAPSLKEVNQSVEFFSVDWNTEENTGAGREIYFRAETSEQCGQCTMPGMQENQTSILCTRWTQDGQVCNVTVTALINTSACYLESQKSLTVLILLKGPAQPEFLTVVPVYSIENLMLVNCILSVCNDKNVNEDIWPATRYGLLLDNLKSKEESCLRPTVNHTISVSDDFQANFLQESSKQYSLTAYAKNSFGVVKANYTNNIDLKNPYLMIMNVASTNKAIPPMFRINLKVHASINITYGPEPNCSALTSWPVNKGKNNIDFTLDSPSANYSGKVCFIVTAENMYNFQKIEVHHSFFYDYSRSSSKQITVRTYIIVIAFIALATHHDY